MSRVLFLTLINLALPFLLYYLRHWVWRLLLARRTPTAKVITNTPKVPPMNWDLFIKLLALGVLLLAAVLFGIRLGGDG